MYPGLFPHIARKPVSVQPAHPAQFVAFHQFKHPASGSLRRELTSDGQKVQARLRPRLREVARSQKSQKPEARKAKLRSAVFWDAAFPAPPLCVPLRSTAAAFRCVPGSCVPALCVLLRSGLFCVLGATALRSAAFQGCCVPLRSAFLCVLGKLHSCVLRSALAAFSCVLRGLRYLRSAFSVF